MAAVTVVSMFTLAYSVGTCVDVPEWHEKSYGFTFHCTDGEWRPAYIPTANLVLGVS